MTIQEWFKNGVQYDSEGTQIWAVEKTKDADYLHHVADIRGWGEIQNLFKLDMNKAAEFQDRIGKFIAEAINEKLEREHSLPTPEQSKKAMLRRKTKFIDNMDRFSSRKNAYKQGWQDCYNWLMSQGNDR